MLSHTYKWLMVQTDPASWPVQLYIPVLWDPFTSNSQWICSAETEFRLFRSFWWFQVDLDPYRHCSKKRSQKAGLLISDCKNWQYKLNRLERLEMSWSIFIYVWSWTTLKMYLDKISASTGVEYWFFSCCIWCKDLSFCWTSYRYSNHCLVL